MIVKSGTVMLAPRRDPVVSGSGPATLDILARALDAAGAVQVAAAVLRVQRWWP